MQWSKRLYFGQEVRCWWNWWWQRKDRDALVMQEISQWTHVATYGRSICRLRWCASFSLSLSSLPWRRIRRKSAIWTWNMATWAMTMIIVISFPFPLPPWRRERERAKDAEWCFANGFTSFLPLLRTSFLIQATWLFFPPHKLARVKGEQTSGNTLKSDFCFLSLSLFCSRVSQGTSRVLFSLYSGTDWVKHSLASGYTVSEWEGRIERKQFANYPLSLEVRSEGAILHLHLSSFTSSSRVIGNREKRQRKKGEKESLTRRGSVCKVTHAITCLDIVFCPLLSLPPCDHFRLTWESVVMPKK